ncbi:hypothetical protein ABZ656_26190 [Streptomyces sp. NPDC007095]|uniref:hypothetical protein n=1 Tax=Streptomyces sp. NPDC007095 TaxID=3154482 RepID=UPI0033FA80B7
MRAPEELNEVDWAALEHAYGPAGDVPEMIRVLYAVWGAPAPESLGGRGARRSWPNFRC